MAKNTRKISNQLIFPKIQLKFAAIASMIVVLSTTATYLVIKMVSQQMLAAVDNVNNTELYDTIVALNNYSLNVIMCINIASIITLFCVIILITHRFLGPVVSIIRYFEDLKSAKETQLVERATDGLSPLFDYLKTVDIKVSSKNNNKGMTLIEVLVSIFIFSIITMTLASNMNTVNMEMKSIQAKSSKSDLATVVRTNAADYASLYNSAQKPENAVLKNCITGNTPCTHNADVEFNYYTTYNPTLIGGVSGVTCPGSASDPSPVFYTTEGQVCNCTDSATKCPLQMITKYTAYCSTGATCKYPVGIKVSYQIIPRPDLPANYSINISKMSGSFFTPVIDNTYFVKFIYGGSYTTDPANTNFSVAEYEIRQGSNLSFLNPSTIRMNISFSAATTITEAWLYRYKYPDGCTSANLGSILGDGTDCNPPSDSSYTQVKKIATLSTNASTLSAVDSIAQNIVVDYKVVLLDASGNTVASSLIPLRAAYSEEGTLTVTPPASGIYFVCDPAHLKDSNTFQFSATPTLSGWSSFTAKVSPPLKDGSTDLPGFSAFDKGSSAVQNIVVDPTQFVPDGNYTVTFQGTSNSGVIKQKTADFHVNAKPTRIANITLPAYANTAPYPVVRTISNLMLTTNIKLQCGETLNNVNLKVKDSSTLLNDGALSSSCTKDADVAPYDENNYTCTKSYDCTTWLGGLSSVDACATKYSSNKDLTATVTALYSGSVTPLVTTNTFTAGAKINAYLQKDYIRFYNFNLGVYGITPPAKTKINVQLGASLLSSPAESINLTFKGTDYEQSFTCTYGVTAGPVTYNSNVCTIQLPTPAHANVLTLSSTTPSVNVVTPNVVTFLEVKSSDMVCGAPTCTYPKTLHTKLTKLGTYDNQTWVQGSANSFSSPYTLQKTDATLDFFVYYKPTSSSTLPSIEGECKFQLTSSSTLTALTEASDFENSFNKCSSWNKCESSVSHIKTSLFNRYSGSYADNLTITSRTKSNVNHEMLIIRECYCD